MKINTPVTQVERAFPKGKYIVSRTDLKGMITYANDTFVEISGFGREDLMGKNHNVVRHPDMLPGAFAWLWDTLKEGRPWRGIVKNGGVRNSVCEAGRDFSTVLPAEGPSRP